MATATLSHKFTATETYAPFATGTIPTFTGAFTINGTRGVGSPGTMQLTVRLFSGSGSPVCWQSNVQFSGTSLTLLPLTRTVNDVPAQWACTSFVGWDVAYASTQFTPQTKDDTITITLDYTAPGPPVPCPFGTQASAASPAVALLTDVAILAACTAVGASWLATLFAPLVGRIIDTGILCGTGPPTISTITPQSLFADIEDKWTALQAIIWYAYCECKPGSPTPPPYPLPTVPRPPGWPDQPSYTCDNANICATLQMILRRLDEMSATEQTILKTDRLIRDFQTKDFVQGNAHGPLTGQNLIHVQGIIGVRIDLTQSAPGNIVKGAINYIMDQGWIAIGRAGCLLEERRISQFQREWFPDTAWQADAIYYQFNPGAIATITELLPALS